MTETKVTSLSDHRQQRAESRFEAAIRKFMAIGRTQEEATVLLGSNHRKPLRPFSRAAAINADERSTRPDIEIRPGGDMKVNVEIDCTPLEARQFIGLPDVAPMQIAVMDELQQQMMANIDKLSPEALMQSWFTFDPKLAERFQDLFAAMMAGLAGTRTGSDKK
jgi:hypothetical protein